MLLVLAVNLKQIPLESSFIYVLEFKKKLRRVWLQTFRYIPKEYKAWFGFLPSGLLLKLLFLQFLQEFDWKDPGELHSLCKGQQDTVTLHNFRRSCVTFAEYLLWHEDLGLGQKVGGGESAFSLYKSEAKAQRGEGTCLKSHSCLVQRLEWVSRSFDSKFHAFSNSSIASCNYSK